MNTSESRAVTRRVLIAAIAPQADALACLLDDRQAVAAVDWDWLMERAESHRVAALVASRLRCGPIAAHIPSHVRARCDAIQQRSAQRVDAARRTLHDLVPGLRSQAIPFLLIKGSLLAERVYRDPLIRPFYDIDVIVPRSSLPAAEAFLRSWGYALGGTWMLLGPAPASPLARQAADHIARQAYLLVFHNLAYVPLLGDGRRPIDLHWQIVPRGRLRMGEDQLWAQTTLAEADGLEVRTLNGEATLIHQAMHALEAWFHSFRLLHLCDLAWMVANGTERYANLWPIAHDWGATYHVELALRLVDRLFAVPAARTLLAGRRPSAWMRSVLRLAGREQVLVDRNITDADPWPRRATVELAWGLAVRGVRAKVGFSIVRRIARSRWLRAERRAQARVRG